MIKNFNLFINEDVSLAKSILNKHKDKIPLGEKDPDYLSIRSILKGQDGYVGLFTRLHYENNITLENLKTLLNDITALKEYLYLLPKPITQYDNYEKIYDDLRTLESKKHLNHWLKEMPSVLKGEYKNLNNNSKEKFSQQILTWMKLETDVKDSIYRLYFGKGELKGKISSFKNFESFLSDLVIKINSATEGFEFENVLSHIQKTNAQVVYSDYNTQIVVAYIPDKETSKQLGKDSSWCISYQDGKNLWDNYNSLDKLTKQYFIWNFNLPFSDTYCMIALTVNEKGEIKFIHKKDDSTIISSYLSYFKQWKISKSWFKPLSKKEIEYRKKLIEYDKIIKDYSVLEIDVVKFNKIIEFFGNNFDWNNHFDCIRYLIYHKLNDQFYNLIRDEKLNIPKLIKSSDLLIWTVQYENLELFYYILNNYSFEEDYNDISNQIYLSIFNIDTEENKIIEIVKFFESKIKNSTLFGDTDISRGFFDTIIERDYLELFKLFYNRIPIDQRNNKIYYPERISGGRNTFISYVNYILDESSSNRTKIVKPFKIIEFLINNGAWNSRDLFVYLFKNNKNLYEKLINNSFPDNDSEIYSNLIRTSSPQGFKELRTDIINDLISRKKFDISYYVERNIINDLGSIISTYEKSSVDFIYLIDLLLKYVENNGSDEKIKEILFSNKGYKQQQVYEYVLKLTTDKIYPLLKYFPKDCVSNTVDSFIQKNDLIGIKKLFDDYEFDPKEIGTFKFLLTNNKEIIKYILSKNPKSSIGCDELVKFNKKHPELLESLLKSVNYNISYLYATEDFNIFKKVMDEKPDYTEEKEIWQFKPQNLIYAIDNKNLKLQKKSLNNAIMYNYIPDSPYGVETVKKMLQAGCDIKYTEYINDDEHTIFFATLKTGNCHVFKFLVEEYNMNPYDLKSSQNYSRDKHLINPLKYAIESQNPSIVEYIINKFKKPITPEEIRYFTDTHIDEKNCQRMSNMVIKYVKPNEISNSGKENLVYNYSDNFKIFCNLFNIYKPEPTELLKRCVNYSRNSNEIDIAIFLVENGANVQEVYDVCKRGKSLSTKIREYFKDYLKGSKKIKKENIEIIIDFKSFQNIEKNENKMKYLKEFNEYFSETEAPVKTPVKTPTKTPPRPSPIRRDKPSVTPRPKATIEDVLKRVKSVSNNELIKIIKNKYK